ncbi:hypothetical protein DSL72_008373 [Monilinia vaccinii-corymbosi]|uniref:Uncharacterized protein n=1 Tax=Monilinia vaccinii-corymbosi TaxID=61207 RepID=A0A8A3PKG7_9HELO|nr:hypothetical protein DSL72_008373 [Monilinia vaccinii-corymbosi]
MLIIEYERRSAALLVRSSFEALSEPTETASRVQDAASIICIQATSWIRFHTFFKAAYVFDLLGSEKKHDVNGLHSTTAIKTTASYRATSVYNLNGLLAFLPNVRDNNDDNDTGETESWYQGGCWQKHCSQEARSPASVKYKDRTDVTAGVAGEVEAGTDGQMVRTKGANGEKATAKKRVRASVSNKAFTEKGKNVKSKATWESFKAQFAAQAKAVEMDIDSEDQDA